jgi:hypothetical protein
MSETMQHAPRADERCWWWNTKERERERERESGIDQRMCFFYTDAFVTDS